MTDPLRWSEDPNAPDGLRELLRAAQADEPTAVELGRLRGRVLAPRPALISAKLILIGVFAVGIGAAIIARTHGDNTAQPVAAIEAAPIAPPPQPPPPPPPAVAATPPAPPKSHATPHASPKPHRVVQADPPAPVDPIPDAAPPPLAAPAKPHVSEVALLEQARASLRSGNAAAALALADNAAAQYPDGVLVEEREALAIEALIKLDRKADARAKWSQFASSYPHSNYRARLQHYF